MILKEEFQDGVLLSKDSDFSKKDSVKQETYKDEREAVYSKGNDAWIKYLRKNLNAKVALKSVKGGTVYVQFIIDTVGKVQNIFIKKSVEYALDEEAKRVIEKSSEWNPAFQNGKFVKAYRIQPISFSVGF